MSIKRSSLYHLPSYHRFKLADYLLDDPLEAQWVEPVSLTFHSVFRKLYTKPSIGTSYQVLVHLAIRFQRRFFLEINQLETRIACGGHVFLANQDEMSNF